MKPLAPAPIIDGVSASRIKLPAGDWPSVYAFLCAHFRNVSPDQWASRFAMRRILDEDGRALTADHPYREGQLLRYYRQLPAELSIPFEAKLVFENEHILVADKPHFLPVMPRGRYVEQTLLTRLRRKTNNPELHTVHRIDRETAGLVLLSKQVQTRHLYQNLFRDRKIDKTYLAIAPRLDSERPLPCSYRSRIEKGTPFFRMCERSGTPNSETLIESATTLQGKDLQVYVLKPVTGRKHQLRVHMNALGAPIVGDRIYPTVQAHDSQDFSHPLQLLASQLQFTDPVSGEQMQIASQRMLHGLHSCEPVHEEDT